MSDARNTFSVRLEFQFPDAFIKPFEKPFEGHDGPINNRFNKPEPPSGHKWPVLPGSGTALGTICAKVEYDSAVFKVKAFVYPALLYPPSPGPSFPYPPTAADGTSTDGGFVWRWGAGNAVPGADHAASPGAPDRLAVWYQPNSSAGFTFDGSTPFYGVTNPYPCGTGSGSAMMMVGGIEELEAAEMLLVSVRGGPFHGDHPAKRTASRRWTVDLGKDRWEISAEQPGRMVILTGSKSAESKRIETNPFMAVFPAAVCGAREDVLVSVP